MLASCGSAMRFSRILLRRMLSFCYKNRAATGGLDPRSPNHAKGTFAMATRSDITPELCRQLLRYEPEAGRLFWKPRLPELFAAPRHCSAWNARYAYKEAFTFIGNHGYREGAIHRVNFTAQRVVYAIVHGFWPNGVIDHIDGDRLNNRVENLRDVPQSINLRNASGKSNNTSGETGVSFRPGRGKWRARVMVDGVERSLGHFNTKEEAIAAHKAAMRQDGFTERHGSFR